MMQIIIILLLSSIKVALFEHILTNRISNGLICSGKRYDAKKYPYVVSLSIQPKNKPYGYICTGTLINELYILTASHCTFGVTIDEVKVYQGSALNNTVTRNVVEIHIPKGYNPADEFPDGDICVLKLKNEFPNLKTFIKIGGEPKEFADHKALKCIFIGFGIKDNKSTLGEDGNIIEALVRHGKTDCKDYDKRRLVRQGWPQFLCSQPTTVNDLRMTCQGDSGGPMICNNKLYGICSFMYKIGKGNSVCGEPDVQTVHTFVHYFLKWVNGIILSKGNDKNDDKKDDDKKDDDKKDDDKKDDDKKDDKKEEEKKKKKKKKKKKSSGNSIKPYFKFHRIVTILLYCVLIFIWN